MEHTIPQPDLRAGASHAKTPSFRATITAAAASSIGRTVGAKLAVAGQQAVQKLRKS
jgi:hypothetical protein